MSLKRKILLITPFCCTIAYLLLGFLIGGTAWAWGLCVYLLVPIMPYVVGLKKIVISVALVISVIYVVGCLIAQHFGYSIWHPAWVVFLLIPVIEILKTPGPKKGQIEEKTEDEDTYDAE